MSTMSNMEKAKKILSEFKASEVSQMTEYLVSVHKFIVKDAKNATLPEKFFISDFLPYFCGVNKLNLDNAHIPSTWVTIAGSPTNWVDLTDDEGNVVASVPGIYDSSAIPSARTNYAEVFHQFALIAKNLPPAGSRYIANVAVSQEKLHASEKYREGWIKIYERYAKEIAKIKHNDNKATAISREIDEVLIYDFEDSENTFQVNIPQNKK